MARWKLNGKHYLRTIPPTEYEYKETNEDTGRQARKVFEVPLELDPNSPRDCNYPGEIIVCHEGKGERRDITFRGPPSPEMEPLDAEAEAITAEMQQAWGKQFMEDSLESSSDRLVRELADTMTQAFGGQKPSQSPIAEPSSELEALKRQVAELTALLKGPTGEPEPIEAPVRRR